METNLVTTNDALGELSDLAFEKIKSSLKAFELPESVQQAICDLADTHAMLSMRMTGGPGSVNNEDLGSSITGMFGAMDILDKACRERA